ncbi:acid protease [Decorospora gaudefroyi]|uniref:Acid protease n=1 Tax=Decorospora gaudefroyi TaxID=184978 RepID=A0A6A5K398_9PLEO|nr:acid protease [Decorospora gaudefroyi]
MRLAPRATGTPEPYVVPPSKEFDGNDGSWSTFKISVGTPGQDFRVLPSTKGAVTYVIAPDGCLEDIDPADCPQLRGIEVFNSAQNIGFQVNESTTWSTLGQYDVDLEEALNLTTGGLFGTDTVRLGAAADRRSSLSLDRQVVAGVADPSYYLGLIALGQAKSSFNSAGQLIDSFLYQLVNSTKIPSFAYAYTAGAQYRLKSVFGSLVLGGYDATRFMPTTNDFSFTFSQDPSRLLTVGVESILATNTLQGTFSLTSSAHFSVIDSTVPHLWLPEYVCDEFETAFGLTYDPQTGLYLVNDTIHAELTSRNPTVTFKLVDSLEDTTTNYTNIELPYAAFDLQASYPFYPNATNYFPIRRAANEMQYVLGRTLLQEAYLIVDYERANFTVAQAVFPDPLPAAEVISITRPSASESTPDSSSGLSTGVIVGIVIGAVAALLLAILAFFFFRKWRSKRIQQKRHELTGKPISMSEADSRNETTPGILPLKASGPQELSGTPLTELASPISEQHSGHGYPQDQKTVVNVNDRPQELHGESRTPITPRWQEVYLPETPSAYEMDGEGTNRSVSRRHSDDGNASAELGVRSAVSPLTPQFQQL